MILCTLSVHCLPYIYAFFSAHIAQSNTLCSCCGARYCKILTHLMLKAIGIAHFDDDVLGSSASVAPTDASSMPSLSGESEMRRSCMHTPLTCALCEKHTKQKPSVVKEHMQLLMLAMVTCLLKSALICSSNGSMSLKQNAISCKGIKY